MSLKAGSMAFLRLWRSSLAQTLLLAGGGGGGAGGSCDANVGFPGISTGLQRIGVELEEEG